MLAGDRDSDEFGDAHEMTFTNHRQFLHYRCIRHGFPELPLENDDVFATEDAAPRLRRGGGGGVPLGEEIVGGGADFGEIVDFGAFR